MTKTKTIMDMTPQELLKMFVADVGILIKAENETVKTILMAEIKASEARQTKRLEAVKEELKSEIRQGVNEHAERIEKIEDQLELSPKN